MSCRFIFVSRTQGNLGLVQNIQRMCFCSWGYFQAKSLSSPVLMILKVSALHTPCSPGPRQLNVFLRYLISPGFFSKGKKAYAARVTAVKDLSLPPPFFSRLLHSCPIRATSLSVWVSSPQPQADYSYWKEGVINRGNGKGGRRSERERK